MNKRQIALSWVTTAVFACIAVGSALVYWTRQAPNPLPLQTPVATRTPLNQTTTHRYTNLAYGLQVNLPTDWTGYSVRIEQWEGRDIQTGAVATVGPRIVLRHPLWTQNAPYEDLPILIFTPSQWQRVKSEALSLGAAPMGPSSLASNSAFVFALPARYNYDFSKGFEALDAALHAGAVTAIPPTR